MGPAPTVSVITPAYNAELTIGRAIGSVRRQSIGDWEMIVVDDGSVDGTSEAARHAAGDDSRVVVVRQENAGTGAARNRGLSEARGRYIVFLDADDELLHDYMAKQVEYAAANPSSSIIGCNVIMRDEDADSLWSGPRVAKHALTLQELLRDNTISVMSLVEREAIAAVGGLRSVYAEDYDLWIRLMAAGFTHCHQPRLLGVYYRTPGSKSSRRKREWVAVSRMLRRFSQSGLPDAESARTAAESAQRFADMYRRVILEECLIRGRVPTARRLVFGTRRSFRSLGRYLLAVTIVLCAPRWIGRRLRSHPSGYTAFTDLPQW